MRQLVYAILLLVQGAAWGAQFSMLKLAMQGGYGEIAVLFIALLLISIGYFLFLCLRRALFFPTREIIVFLVVTSVLGYVIPLLAAIYAAPYLPAGIMTLIASLTPVVTVSVALLLRTERVSSRRIGAVVLGTLAAFLVLLPELALPGFGTFTWMLLIGLVPLCYGLEPIYVFARWPRGLDAWQVGFGEAVAATLLMLPIFLVFGDFSIGLTWSEAETGILLFAVAGLVEVVLYFYIIQQTGGVLVSFSNFISLFAGIGWGMLLFGESHGALVWAAVFVLIAALVLLALDMRKAAGAGVALVQGSTDPAPPAS